MKYKKKPVVIEALQWNGQNSQEILALASGTDRGISLDKGCLIIGTLEGSMKANVGDYIIKGIKGEIYPCRLDIFNETYEEVKQDE